MMSQQFRVVSFQYAPQSHRRPAPWALACALACALPLACTGAIGDGTPGSSGSSGSPPGNGATPGSPGAPGAGTPGSPGSAGGTPGTPGGVPGSPGDPTVPPPPASAPPTTGAVAACQSEEAPGPRRLRLLTRNEYASTAADLLFIPRPSVDNLPVESIVDGFDNNAGAAVVTNRHLDEFLATSERLAVQAIGASKVRLAPCAPAAGCDRTFIQSFGQRAFRRPLTPEEVTRYLTLFAPAVTGGSFDKGMELVIRAMLSSPYFLYRSEMGDRAPDGTFKLSPFELATALSYFLWGTTPDDQLLEAARTGALAQPAGFEAAARRLIDDRRSRPAVVTFFREWLGTDGFLFTNKDAAFFPRFDDTVRKAMVEEQDAFVSHVVFDSTGKLDELFNADYVMASQPLARFYGLAGGGAAATLIPGRATPAAGVRGGLLLLGSVLGMYAHSNETSPVRRGVFVRARLMCQTLPPPPENLNIMPPGLDPRLTTRKRFLRHSSDALCQACHKFIDPVGFGFERYDGVGAFRTQEAGEPIDDSGEIVGLEDLKDDSKKPFSGPAELASILGVSPNAQACFARQMFRYARGGEDGGRDVVRDPQAADCVRGQRLRHQAAAARGGATEVLPDPEMMRSHMRNRLSRRSFLAQAVATGAAIELPIIGRPGKARAAAPLNFVSIFVPDGVVPALWYPKGSETQFTLGEMSAPLSAIKDDCIFFEGVGMPGGEPTHPGGSKKVLTATAPQSLDVFLGQRLKGSAPFDSIQLGVASNFENGSGSVSFIGTGQEVKHDDDPINVFNRLFGDGPVTPTTPPPPGAPPVVPPTPDLRLRQKKSILDAMRGDLTALQMRIGTAEKARLDLHLQSLREVEIRLAGLLMPPPAAGGAPAPGGGSPPPRSSNMCSSDFDRMGYQNGDTGYPRSFHKNENFDLVGKLQTDLLVLALSCSLTHSVSLMWSHAVSPTKVPGVGGPGNHDASHYGVQVFPGMAFTKNRLYFMQRFVELVQRLKRIPYGDSNLLEHTVIYLNSDINDGDLHDHRQIPFVLAGGAKAGLRGGRFLDFTAQGAGGQNETHAKLLVSITRSLGVPVDSYGYTAGGTGPLNRL